MKYQVIYADPPWDYGNTKQRDSGFWGSADNHYSTMKTKDICALPVQSITSDDCFLFLWVTSPFIQKAFTIISAWGFKYSTVGFVWVKVKKSAYQQCSFGDIDSALRTDGIGHYTLSNAEYCLIAKKGKYWREQKNVSQIIFAPKTRHSEKPEEARTRIIKLCGDVPRIELFARTRTEGWDVWGNEVENSINLEAS